MRRADDREVCRRWIERARREPDFYAYEVFGLRIWSAQTEALCSWRDNRRTSFRSCNGIGKSVLGGVGVLWLGSLWEDTLILTTATTFSQVRGQVWNEIHALAQDARIPLGAELLSTEIRWPHKSRAIGITAPAHDVSKMQGYRGRGNKARTFILADEAGGISAAILEGLNSMLTGEDSHLLLDGNPTDPTSEFKRTFDRAGVSKIHVSAFTSPNFTRFGITIDDIRRDTWRAKITGPLPFGGLISPQWVAELYEKVGKDETNPEWIARVLGEFPVSNASGLVPSHWYDAAVALGHLTPVERAEVEQVTGRWPDMPRRAGCDVGRSEMGDPSVITTRRGVYCRSAVRVLRGYDSIATARALQEVATEERCDLSNIDEGGVGAGVVDQARAIGMSVNGCMFGASARSAERFANFRAEEFMALRDRFHDAYRASRGEPVIPGIVLEQPDEMLGEELATIRWSEDARGRTVIEPKDETKKRLPKQRSPDRADAMMLTFASASSPVITINPDTNWVGPQWAV